MTSRDLSYWGWSHEWRSADSLTEEKGAPHIIAARCENHGMRRRPLLVCLDRTPLSSARLTIRWSKSTEIKADVDARVLSFAKRAIRCLSIASPTRRGRRIGDFTISLFHLDLAQQMILASKRSSGHHFVTRRQPRRNRVGDRHGNAGVSRSRTSQRMKPTRLVIDHERLPGCTSQMYKQLQRATTDAAHGASAIVPSSPEFAVIVETSADCGSSFLPLGALHFAA